MSTVDKKIADDIIAGRYPEDNAIKIVEYTNAWGTLAYGVIFKGDPLNKYKATEWIRNPRIYWQKGVPT